MWRDSNLINKAKEQWIKWAKHRKISTTFIYRKLPIMRRRWHQWTSSRQQILKDKFQFRKHLENQSSKILSADCIKLDNLTISISFILNSLFHRWPPRTIKWHKQAWDRANIVRPWTDQRTLSLWKHKQVSWHPQHHLRSIWKFPGRQFWKFWTKWMSRQCTQQCIKPLKRWTCTLRIHSRESIWALMKQWENRKLKEYNEKIIKSYCKWIVRSQPKISRPESSSTTSTKAKA